MVERQIFRLTVANLLLTALSAPLLGRIISYAPVTDRAAVPAVQHRTNRHYVLIETEGPAALTIPSGTSPLPFPSSKLVLYDSRGQTEPRVVLPKGSAPATIPAAAVWQGSDETLRILAYTNADSSPGAGPPNVVPAHRFLYSPDGGETWGALQLPPSRSLISTLNPDVGGPVVRGRGSPIRIGSRDFPFALLVYAPAPAQSRELYVVASDGSARLLAQLTFGTTLIGSNREGTRFLLAGFPLQASPHPPLPTRIGIVGLAGGWEEVDPTTHNQLASDGWITPDGDVYLDEIRSGTRSLAHYRNGVRTEVAVPQQAPTVLPSPPGLPLPFFGVPTADFSGAWILRGGGKSNFPSRTDIPTNLLLHTPGTPAREQWSDPSAPQVEALHAGASGRKLLIQVHRPRPQADQRLIIDPALAVWEVGQPAPSGYDELFLNEGFAKAFVHLDVDRLESGAPFVFDSATQVSTNVPLPSPLPPPAAGGGDVMQEWGVVRGSLRQRLVIPIAARTPGAFGSFWRTDVLLRNPSDIPTTVGLRFVPGLEGSPRATSLELEPREVRVLRDVLATSFGIESGSGALFLTPGGDSALHVTSRTYTTSDRGTFGMGVGAVESTAASSARFPLTFSGALQGSGFRTNLLATDASNRGGVVALRASSGAGFAGRPDFSSAIPAGGQTPLNGLSETLSLTPDQSGAVMFLPLSGELVPAMIAVDNRTNDPTYFPPDLPAPYVRTIPAIVHLDGANGAKWRSDLFLFNPSDRARSVLLGALSWEGRGNESLISLALAPRESRVLRDVLRTVFGKTGMARLRYQSNALDSSGVRATSRIYTEDASGGTYGFLMPPLNSFQSAGAGEALEILGPQGGENFRTNLALVDLAAPSPNQPPGSRTVKIEIFGERGTLLDSFEARVPIAGGVQFGDLFRARGLGDGPAAAVIRVSPNQGVVGAFATMTDNGTNDSVYFGAALASK